MNEPIHPLLHVAHHVHAHARQTRLAVIFDLDSTLFGVSPRTEFILRQLGNELTFRDTYREAAEILLAAEVRPSDYSVREILARTPLQPTPELIDRIRLYWRDHFFSGAWLHKDEVYPGAREYVERLQQLGAHIVYLTGRHEGRMREGTEQVLKAHGFPLPTPADLLMKPLESETDEHFKVTALKELNTRFDDIWFFENEPVIIHDVRKALPLIQMIYVDSAHSKKAEPPTDLPTITPDYRPGLVPLG